MSSEDIILVEEKDASDVQFLGSHKDDCIIVYEKTTKRKTNKRHKGNSDKHFCISAHKPQPEPVISDASPSASNSSARLSCCICLESASRVNDKFFSTTCGHLYCESCMDKVMRLSKQANCAVCRKKLTKRQYHRIFLN